jgi:hypothetical protein
MTEAAVNSVSQQENKEVKNAILYKAELIQIVV